MKKSVIFLMVVCSVLLMRQNARALSIKDSTAFSMPVYVIDWTDNDGKPRKVAMVKDSYPSKTGICVLIKYYDGNTPVTIQSYNPNDGNSWNSGFGGTVHHDMTYHNGGTLTLAFQGPHHAIFNWVQSLDGSVETVTYTFTDGLDYFQWQETVDTRLGTKAGDSRGPYCTMQWDGVDFSAVTGQEYGAQKYFSQPTYNGPWTFTGTVDIPYVLQWDNNREVGYVQTQTFTQQLAGAPNWGGSLNLAASGSTVPAGDEWKYDFQMNFYDAAKKLTWGMPYGYMNGSGDGAAALKNSWGQYSLSIVFDAQSENGVKRVRDENRVIHNGNVTLTASVGSIVTTGPVGTSNPATQTLSPAGYDHNYRTWWAQASGSGEANLTMNVSSGILKNPTFRIKNMSGLPGTVEYNGAAIVSGTDYYASFNASTNEVWLTLKRDVSGSKTIRIVDAVASGIIISASSVTPSSVYNNVSNNLTFSVTATDDGSVSNVKLNLTSIGGGSAVTMTPGAGNTYSYSFTMAAGVSVGTKTIVATVTDNSGNQKTENITLTVNANVSYLDIYTDATTMITGKWNSNGTLTEQTGGGAIEGTKDYLFNFTSVSWYAGFGLNFTGYDDLQAKDFSTYETLEVSYQGPSVAGSGIALTLTGTGSNNNSVVYNLPASATYTTVQIPLTVFGTFDLTKITGMGFSITGSENSTGTLRFDNVRLSRQNTVTAPEINVKAASTSIATAGTYNFTSVNEGTSGTAVTFTIENTGNGAMTLFGAPRVVISGTNASEFSISQASVSNTIAASGNNTFTITFSPTTDGAKTAAITISSDDADEASYVINLTGTALPVAPEINVKAASTSIAIAGTYNFTSVNEGTSGTAVTFTIENTGNGAMTLFGAPRVVISGTNASEFSISQASVSNTIAASGNNTFTITFSPTTDGAKTAAITISSDDADEASYVINLTGTALPVAPEINVKAGVSSVTTGGTHSFGSVLENTSGAAVTFTIENTGNGAMTLFGAPRVVISGTNASEFSISQASVSNSIVASGSNTFTITFSPTSIGSKTAAITITSDDADEASYVINLTGTALSTAPEINVKAEAASVLSGATYNFISVTEGTSGTAITFTIENTGTSVLSLSGSPIVAISGANASDFTIHQTSTLSSISVAGTTTFTIVFSPSSAGNKSASINIASNDGDESSYTISLTGTASVATGITDRQNTNIKIYPNPAGNVIFVSTEGGRSISLMTLRNHLGAIVREVKPENASGQSENSIELQELPSGIYYLELDSSEGRSVRKIVKQ